MNNEYDELGKTPEMEDKLGSIIPPEDMLLCNDAEGCDNCKWIEVCFPPEPETDYLDGCFEKPWPPRITAVYRRK